MILAAGLGTRLQPLTNDRPKALVEVAGYTLLELTLRRLKSCGIIDVIINTHHFAEMIAGYLTAHHNFGMDIAVSREEVLLDTGGGLKKAEWFFRTGNAPEEPFLVHNVDVLSSIDFELMLQQHNRIGALATLAVQDRPTSRYLLFDETGLLCGRRAGIDGAIEQVRQSTVLNPRAFSGIHIISPKIFDLMHEDGVFSIIPTYLRLAGAGESVCAFSADQYHWRDLGRPEHIIRAAQDIQNGTYKIE